jgi:hypothetical protein
MTRTAVCRSDNYGMFGWQMVIADNFRHEGPAAQMPVTEQQNGSLAIRS